VTVPVPFDWTSVPIPSRTADLNPGLRDVDAFILGRPHAKAYRSTAGTALTGGTASLVNLDGELFDSTNSMHSLTSNISRVSAPYPGIYWCNAAVGIAGQSTSGRVVLDVRLNALGSSSGGASVLTTGANASAAGVGTTSFVNISGLVSMNAGDYVEMFCTPATTQAPNASAAQTFLELSWWSLQ
jgi:hypothetical protein